MIKALFYRIFKTVRGASVESGGYRELSSGILSDKIRIKAAKLSIGLSGKLLEIGCGEGLFLESMANAANQQLFGVEPARSMLLRTKTRFSTKAVPVPLLSDARGEALPFKKGSFDGIICVNTLHNLKSVQVVHSILKEAARVCKPGASLIFDIRNRLNPIMYLLYRYAYIYDASCQNLPLHTYSPVCIENTLYACGFFPKKKCAVLFPGSQFAPACVYLAQKEE